MFQLSFYIPETHLESVKEALFAAGAGKYNNYDRCCFQTRGTGQFRPLEGSSPFLGKKMNVVKITEYKVEMICQDEYINEVISALKAAHPYEEPAFHAVRLDKH